MPFRLANGAVALSGTLTATSNGSALAVPGADGGSHILVSVHVSAASGTSPTLSCKLQHSDDASSWSDVTGAAQSANLTAAGNALFGGRATKKYVRVVATVGGTTPSFTTSVALFGATA
jgi:hypothetical protein